MCMLFMCFPIYIPVLVVCFMFYCVGELFIKCVCYLCGRGGCSLFESYVLFLGCIVFRWLQIVCVLCLLSQCVSRCSLHMSDLCVCMRHVISV